jgi:hypothetical protein
VLTIRPWRVNEAIATLDQALIVLDALAVMLRSHSGPKPIGIAT